MRRAALKNLLLARAGTWRHVLARVPDAIQDKRDVEDLVDGLLDEDDDEN